MAILIFNGVGDEFDVKVVFGYFDKERSDFGFALLPVQCMINTARTTGQSLL